MPGESSPADQSLLEQDKFVFAAGSGDLKEAKHMLDNNLASVDGHNDRGITALCLAIWYDRREMVRFLLDKKANANARCTDEKFPLFAAAYHGRTDRCELLLHFGADATSTFQGKTAAEWAAAQGHAALAKLVATKAAS